MNLLSTNTCSNFSQKLEIPSNEQYHFGFEAYINYPILLPTSRERLQFVDAYLYNFPHNTPKKKRTYCTNCHPFLIAFISPNSNAINSPHMRVHNGHRKPGESLSGPESTRARIFYSTYLRTLIGYRDNQYCRRLPHAHMHIFTHLTHMRACVPVWLQVGAIYGGVLWEHAILGKICGKRSP